MKQRLLLGILMLVFIANAAAKPKLTAYLNKELFEVGSIVKVTIKLEGTAITPNPIDGIEPSIFFQDSQSEPTLSYEYGFTAQDEGEHEIGPFTMKVGREALVSNVLRYKVQSYPKDGITISLSNQTIQKGKEFSIILISDIELENSKLKENPLFEFKRMSTSESKVFESGKLTQEFTYEFVVESKKKGRLEISNDLFEDLPGEVSILVAEVFIK